jgi:hypothetical protein
VIRELTLPSYSLCEKSTSIDAGSLNETAGKKSIVWQQKMQRLL